MSKLPFKSLFRCFPSVDSIVDCMVVNARDFRPLSDSFTYTFKLDKMVRASISGLLFFRRPSAVLGRIIKVVINPVERVMDAGPIAHIGYKLAKSLPLSAYSYASSSIPVVVVSFRVAASGFHGGPCTILACFAKHMRGYSGFMGAPAGGSLPHGQTVQPNYSFDSANTSTSPRERPSALVVNDGAESGKAAERMACYVFSSTG